MGVMRIFRRFYRFLLPRKRHELLDGAVVPVDRDADYAGSYGQVIEPDAPPFISARYEEGRRWRRVMAQYLRGGRILDVGAGDGAIELAFAADRRWTCVSVENAWNDTVSILRKKTDAPIRRVVADAAHLPFRDGVFDGITCLETIEHLCDPIAVGEELARVTHASAVMLITTPPRWRFAFRPDPHFNIRGLLFLPAPLQRRIAAKRGYTRPDHYVDRIYQSVT